MKIILMKIMFKMIPTIYFDIVGLIFGYDLKINLTFTEKRL